MYMVLRRLVQASTLGEELIQAEYIVARNTRYKSKCGGLQEHCLRVKYMAP